MSGRRQRRRPQGVYHDKGAARTGVGERLRRPGVALAAVALVAALIAGGLTFGGLLSGGGTAEAKTAAIVDQLSLTFPNPDFAREATDVLEQAGYTVDYYPGQEVTVGFYRTLAERGYDFIALRSHSARREIEGALTDEATLFTAEPYDETKYREEVRARQLGRARYSANSDERYFDVRAAFIEEEMKGRFEDSTVVVLMGCDGLRADELAAAFVSKGAKTVIGWNAAVSAVHTDAATERLLGKLLIAGLPADDAVKATMEEVGPDPAFGAELQVLADGG